MIRVGNWVKYGWFRSKTGASWAIPLKFRRELCRGGVNRGKIALESGELTSSRDKKNKKESSLVT